jgi:hypothetical protein
MPGGLTRGASVCRKFAQGFCQNGNKFIHEPMQLTELPRYARFNDTTFEMRPSTIANKCSRPKVERRAFLGVVRGAIINASNTAAVADMV